MPNMNDEYTAELRRAFSQVIEAEEAVFKAYAALGAALSEGKKAAGSDEAFRDWHRDALPTREEEPFRPSREELEAAEWMSGLQSKAPEAFAALRRRHPRVLSLRTLHSKWKDQRKKENSKAARESPEHAEKVRRKAEQQNAKAHELGLMMQGLKP